MKKLLVLLTTLMLIAILSFLYGVKKLESWANEPLQISPEVIVELSRGMSIKKFSQSLESNQLITSSLMFQAWMKIEGGYNQFQAGLYSFSGEITPKIIRAKIIRGEAYKAVALSFTIPEGFTLRQLNERLAAKNVAPVKVLNQIINDALFQKELGIKGRSFEGYTYPATYEFETMPSAKEVYAKIINTFFSKLPKNYEAQANEKGLSLDQAITFASLIELETMQEWEKPMISEVIWRRLQKKEALGIDAAIIYGIPNYKGDITWGHLKDANNLYNTRIHRGLPPTPIGSPSISSLEAVLNPSNLGYYYYMLDADDKTKHVFSKTLSEHNANVQKFLKHK